MRPVATHAPPCGAETTITTAAAAATTTTTATTTTNGTRAHTRSEKINSLPQRRRWVVRACRTTPS